MILIIKSFYSHVALLHCDTMSTHCALCVKYALVRCHAVNDESWPNDILYVRVFEGFLLSISGDVCDCLRRERCLVASCEEDTSLRCAAHDVPICSKLFKFLFCRRCTMCRTVPSHQTKHKRQIIIVNLS